MRYVLFVCNHNAGRSQMAEAFFKLHAPEDVSAESAGSAPAEQLWPNVVEAMREVGVDLRARRPEKLTLEMQLHADWAVTMGCGDACPFVATTVEDWDIADPADAPIEQVREIRDDIEARVRALIDERLDEIRNDRTAHEMRTARLLSMLRDEFGGTSSPAEMRSVADTVLAGYADAPVRGFVMTLAYRQARERLRGEPVASA
ncbi:MAG: arsenate reductase ArsC [Solirubrobacteraceae bacterium]